MPKAFIPPASTRHLKLEEKRRDLLVAVLAAGILLTAIAQETAGRTAVKETPQQIRTYLSRLEGFGFSGALLVAKEGKILLESAHGLADRQKKIAVRTDTIFDIGSITKQFTAAAILLLESDGKLRVSDPVARYLQGVPEDKKAVTIHHLLTHTSGLAMGFGGDYKKVSREEIVRLAMTSKLQSPPGQTHSYSNAGYSLLAAIVEIVSGQSYETFLGGRIFRPARMTSSGYFFSGQSAHRLARGYREGEDWGIGAERASATGGDFWNLIGNGGLHSTVGDLYRWMLALEQGRVLTKDARQKFFHPHVVAIANYQNSNSPLHYAYGWYVWKRPSGKTLIFHLGGNGIFNAAVRYHVDDQTVVVYASNVSEFHDPGYPVPAIERMLAGEAVETPPQVVALTEEQTAQYAGQYRAATGALLSVESTHPALRIKGDGQDAFSFAVNGKWQTDPTLEALNARTREVVENSRTRNYEALLKAFGPDVTLKQLEEFETLFWKKRHDRHGDYVRTRVLGTIASRARRNAGTTVVAIDFQRGTTYREYIWTREGTIGDLGPLDSPPSSRYFPESPSCFVAFEPAKAEVTRICFEKNGAGETFATVAEGASRIELKKH